MSTAGRSQAATWCLCWGTPEPEGPWQYPDDVHADVCHDSLLAFRAAVAAEPDDDRSQS